VGKEAMRSRIWEEVDILAVFVLLLFCSSLWFWFLGFSSGGESGYRCVQKVGEVELG
jgi:hypothetical protein